MNPDTKVDLEKTTPTAGDGNAPAGTAPDAVPAEDGALTDTTPTQLSQLPQQELLSSIEDWSFGYVFSVVICSLAPSPVLEMGSIGILVFGLRTLWLVKSLDFREILPATTNLRMQLILMPIFGMMYRVNQSGWTAAVMAMIVFLAMQELLNVSSVVNRVKKKIETQERAGKGANDDLPVPAADKKVGGKGQKGKKKKG